MCGIWALILENKEIKIQDFNKLINNFNEIKGRGPDYTSFNTFNESTILGFHRLSIMDKSDKGSQPFYFESKDKKMALICNGEIYNYKSLRNEYDIKTISNSDCEVILPLYNKFGINKLLNLLDGVFSFLIIDFNKITNERRVIAVRDKIGVRPLFYGNDKNNNKYYFCSEIKGLSRIVDNIEVFKPGTFMELKYNEKELLSKKITEYYKYNYEIIELNEDQHIRNIREILTNSVRKRLQSDRPLCCLLSGGLDSSLISSITSRLLKESNIDKKLYTFSIGMEGGTDNIYAAKVAEYINSEHAIVTITKEESLNAITDVIYATETYDITTIRASVGQYLISKYISEKTDYKVILSGDGSDEVASGYIYNYNAPSLEDLQKEAVKRVKEIHIYDGLRADRATSIHGLELRVPFLDSKFVDYYLSINPELRIPKKGRMEKYLLRKSFEGYLPNEILYRKKEAFSDGISSNDENSWHNIIQRYIDERITDEEYNIQKNKYINNTPMTKEAYYYRKIFSELFGDRYNNVIKDFWLPNWCGDIKEPSARVLSVYQDNNTEEKVEDELLKKKLV